MADRAQVAVYGTGDAVCVAGGEQVEQRAAQDGEQQRPLCLRIRGVRVCRLALGEQVKPVSHRVAAELRPRSRLAEQRARVPLDPQREQRAVRRIRQPCPDVAARHREAVMLAAQLLEVPQLFLARPAEQRPDQPFLGSEQEQQHPRARPDFLRERP
jgi:hypothetical protein